MPTWKPLDSNIERWLSQVGSLTHTPLSGSQVFRKSAPTRRPPEEPTVWIVATRPAASAGWPRPSSSACTSARAFGSPSIGR